MAVRKRRGERQEGERVSVCNQKATAPRYYFSHLQHRTKHQNRHIPATATAADLPHLFTAARSSVSVNVPGVASTRSVTRNARIARPAGVVAVAHIAGTTEPLRRAGLTRTGTDYFR